MKIQTNTAISINDGLDSKRSAVINGIILRVVENADGSKVAFYQYEDDATGEILKDDSFPIPAESVQAIYDLVKSGLPADTDYNNRLWTLYYEGMKLEMVNTFNDLTATSQISTIA